MTKEGLVSSPSDFGPEETMDSIVAAVTSRGMDIVARIDHAAAAQKAGLARRYTQVLIFGNPKAGTLPMQVDQTIGIDLPLKILVWQDESDKTWVSYNDPKWLAQRHGIDGAVDTAIAGMAAALVAVVKEATARAG
jgi:uncharacterized protein (DUF302 family)